MAIPSLPLLAFSRARTLGYALESRVLFGLSSMIPGGVRVSAPSPRILRKIAREAERLLKEDVENIHRGYYPAGVFQLESPVRHFRRLSQIVLDGLLASRRRSQGKTTAFDQEAREFLDEMPRYYRRNFHFQTNGYLSKRSAELYDHQVELLFNGTADAMRRMIIPPMKESLGLTDGKGLTFLELGAGTGRATRSVHLAFPKAKIVAIDLSEPYLKKAQGELSSFSHVNFLQADAGALPFQAESFDAVYSVFLFHELPMEARRSVISESLRVLRPAGFMGLVDSLQLGDAADYDELLKSFSKDFHEPFYRSYISHPMRSLLEGRGLDYQERIGLFSKLAWLTRG